VIPTAPAGEREGCVTLVVIVFLIVLGLLAWGGHWSL
jgi:hypothetical protein